MSRSPRWAPEPRLLDTVDFPTDKYELLAHAQAIRVPSAVVDAIRRLRPGTIRSHQELILAVEASMAR